MGNSARMALPQGAAAEGHDDDVLETLIAALVNKRNEQTQQRVPEPGPQSLFESLSPQALHGAFQVWADTRTRRIQSSAGALDMAIAKKLPDKSEMLRSGSARRYILREGETLLDVARGLKARYGLPHHEREITRTLAQANRIRNNGEVESGLPLDLVATLTKLNAIQLPQNVSRQMVNPSGETTPQHAPRPNPSAQPIGGGW